MANDLVPEEPPSASGIWEKIIEAIGDFNLPKVIAGPAGEAIARLIAGGADIPAAWLQQKARAVKDKTEAQSLVTKTLAGAAAELVKKDPALVQRAAEAFIGKEIGHQHNRENIAIKAIEHLKETPDAQATKPDDDWLNMFARHAQEASSERMQDLWSKILAGQLRSPQSFSLQTLRFVSELDEATANLFEKWSARVISRNVIPFPPLTGPEFVELMQLEDFGLISGTTGNLSNQIMDENIVQLNNFTMPIIVEFRSHRLIIEVRKPFHVSYRCAVLTRIGRELYPITKTPSTMDIVKAFASDFGTNNVIKKTATELAPGSKPDVLWAEQSPTPQQ